MDHEQMAAELTQALGRKITFQNPPIDEYCASIETMVFRHMSFRICVARWLITRGVICRARTTMSKS
jgi:hypothetical protein